jgi:transposase InsO family protein
VLEALDMAIWRRGQMCAAGAEPRLTTGSSNRRPRHYDPVRKAAALRRPIEPRQYSSFAFTRRLAAEGLVGSMGTVGDALDNAMCESLLGTMKIEKLNRQPWRSVEDVRASGSRPGTTAAAGTPASAPLEYESQHHDRHMVTNP